MEEVGFFHPEQGYWQVIGGDIAAYRETLPEGANEVPLKPGADYEWDGSDWVSVAPFEPDPLTRPLDRVRFEFLRDKLDRDKPGFIAAAEALFDNLPEDTPAEVGFKLLAKVLWRTGQEFYIHHDLFALAVHEGIITQQELEDAWRAGVALSW